MKKLCIIVVFIFMASCGKKQRPKMPEPVVKIGPVIEKSIASVKEHVARIYADRTVALKARVEGVLEKKLFSDGQMVKKDALLFVIEQDSYLAKVKQAEAKKDASVAKRELANSVFKRMSRLYKKKAVSTQDFDKATSDFSMAEADLKAADASLDEAKLMLKWTEIRAPFDGRTGVSNISLGNLVNPASDTLMTLAKTDLMKVEFSVNEKILVTALQKRKPGQKDGEGLEHIMPELTLANGTVYPHKGKITFWDNRINPATGTMKLRAVFANPEDLLRDGMYSRIRLTFDDAEERLLVPQASIQKDQGGAYVLVYEEASGTAVMRRIETSGNHDVWTIVTKGLKKGEKIVIQGLQKVIPGKKIKIEQASGGK